MPLARIVCHCRDCNGRQSLPPEVALDHAARRWGEDFTYELLASILDQVQDRGERISTTTITSKCLRSEVLQRTLDYEADPKMLYAAFRGTLWHGQLERFAHPQAIAEPRFHVVDLFGLGSFSGSPDLVDPKAGTLYDYKFSKENPRWDKPWDDHVIQVQINRWLVDYSDYVEYKAPGEDLPRLYALSDEGVEWLLDSYGEIEAVKPDVRANRARFVPIDWQGLYVVYMDDKGPKPLLVTKSIQVPKKAGQGTKAARVADVWDDEKIEEILTTKYPIAREALSGDVVPDIPPGFENWLHPLCNYCAVKADCIDGYIEQQVQIRSSRAA